MLHWSPKKIAKKTPPSNRILDLETQANLERLQKSFLLLSASCKLNPSQQSQKKNQMTPLKAIQTQNKFHRFRIKRSQRGKIRYHRHPIDRVAR